MGLPVKQLVAGGFKVAKQLYPEGFSLSTIRLGPTSGVDPVTDVATTAWEVEIEKDLFGYDDADERKALGPDVRQKAFLLDPSDYPAGAKFSQEGQIVHDGFTWEVYRAEIAPGGAVVIFYGRA